MPRDTSGWNDLDGAEPFVMDKPAPDATVYCDRCDLSFAECRCGIDAPSAVNHLRTIIAAARRTPGNIEVPRQLWDSLGAAEDFLLKHHPEE